MSLIPITTLLFVLTFTGATHAQAPYGLTERLPNTSFLPTSTGYALGEMQLRRVFTGAYLDSPVFLTHAGDGTNRIFVCDRRGRIRVFPNRDDVSGAADFLDLRDRVNSGPGEGGLLCVAFHPQYADNGRLFVYYTRGNLYTRVSAFTVSTDNPDSVDPATERVVLELRQPAGNHNGGMLAFGPDGYLYIGLGDGGGGGDPYKNGQDPTTLLATILRIDIDRADDGLEYAIPPDNPFVGNSDEWREEIWAYGLRNPWRFSFDRFTGDLWTGDVGQNAWEEIDLIKAGGNYGWNRMEGFHCYPPNANCQTDDLALPVLEYDHATGRSVTGGYVYRGTRLIRLSGAYLYGDFTFRTIWALRYADGQVIENQVIARSPSLISSFGEDEAGEVYVVGIDGKIYTFDEPPAAPAPGAIPATISASGLYTDPAKQALSPGIIPYSVNSQLWSDGAHKTRFIALPGVERIGFSRDGHWQFPAGTALVKNFYLDLEKGNPKSRQIVETRFLVKREDAETWDGFSYQWNAEGTDAALLEGSATRAFSIADPDAPGGSYAYDYYFPSRTECNLCHTPDTGYVLGVRTAQLNRTHDYSGAVDHQLRALNHIGLFTADIGEDFTGFPRLPDPLDPNADLEDRARSYLDANCANCHNPGGSGRVDMDLRYSTPLAKTGLIDIPPILGDLDLAAAARVSPGFPDSSVVLRRMLALDRNRMPPLATSRVDDQGTALIRRWIVDLAQSTHVTLDSQDLPAFYTLAQNYPNPFNPETTIGFSLSRASQVRVEIFDLVGQSLAVLVDARRAAGQHRIRFDGSTLSTGLYLYRLTAGDYTETRKMLLVK